ncbi:3D-(3,5/4)-trihydroxycyclohexane-1,2-dione acylhydrolase (decyclizing) [Sandaracinus amylolyticus]|uniref:Epi-inositol hydrolase n=1 Tax=Sandaracinus amylolyticus TaxID=927083 RepID=A0A0F6YEZ8_9BACT|nr:3D-(3,5/4)-trihydroxycyclohexane-1,2-dione acylhydrolase (decyclizing) [Sandaracinus amylolyticus]AKF03053.1 Epi-inositol hydrolase [Sandaracinus amylolyticus]
MQTVRLTMAQALVRWLAAQRVVIAGTEMPMFAGVFAIFGHGNVAGIGEALAASEDALPTFRSHNEQSMAHTAIAFAKASRRRRMMACTTSIGPGATNLVTAAATAHVDRLPLLLLPGDVFASRAPDPVLQQLEDERDPSITVNDCLRPVSRYFDRITRPEQLLVALPAALEVLTDPARCGPATLCLPQDVQTMAHDYPVAFFERRVHAPRRASPDPSELARAIEILASSERPLIVAGGGVHYGEATAELAAFASHHGVPVAETQAGKGALAWNDPSSAGAIGVTGSAAANTLAAEADVVLAIGTRLSDFTTASRTLFPRARLVHLNASAFDARKHGGVPLVGDAKLGLAQLDGALGSWRAASAWTERARSLIDRWHAEVERAQSPRSGGLPIDAQVIAVVNEQARAGDVVVCAAGGLPGELHRLWRSRAPGDYHVEYGFSCMGYEIAGGLGVKLARPDAQVVVMVGDGSYLMLNTAIAESVALDRKLVIVVLDNGGFGCIHRLQRACGGAPFSNLLGEHARVVDFVAHASSLGARAEKVADLDALRGALARARVASRTYVVVIETDPDASSGIGGAWWDVAIPEVSERDTVRAARHAYEDALRRR